MAILDGSAVLAGGSVAVPTGHRDGSGRNIKPIGDCLNRLPLSYAPITGTGRYVAYALASASGACTCTPAGAVKADAVVSSAGLGSASPTALRMVPASGAAPVSTVTTTLGTKSLFGATASAVSAGLSAAALRIPGSAQLVTSATPLLTSTALRLRDGACDFTSLYILPRAGGTALNAFALNSGALNSLVGGHRQVFTVAVFAIGNVVTDRSASLSIYAQSAPLASPTFAGSLSVAASVSAVSMANAIPGATTSAWAELTINPFAGALREIQSTCEPVEAAANFSGVLMAGGACAAILDAVTTALGNVIYDSSIDVSGNGAIAAIATLHADTGTTVTMTGTLAAIARKMRVAYAETSGQSTLAAKPHTPFRIEETVVYAPAYDTGLENVIEQSTVYAVGFDLILETDAHESIVYRPTRDSIVYGIVE